MNTTTTVTCDQFVWSSVTGEQGYKILVSAELYLLKKQFPEQSFADLLQDAEEKALEAWDSEQNADYFQGE
jgi:hypothetical protein